MAWYTAVLILVGSVIYIIVVCQLIRYACIGIGKAYRWFRPAPPRVPAPDVIDLDQGRGWRYVPEKGQSILGPNWLPFAVEFGTMLAVLALIRYLSG